MFFLWTVVAVYHSLVTYLVPVLLLGDTAQWVSGHTAESAVTSSTIYSVLLATVSLKAGLETSAWTIFTILSIFGSFILWLIFIALYSILSGYIIPSTLTGAHHYLFTNINTPIIIILTVILALGPDLHYKTVARTVFASEHELGIQLFNSGDTKDGILAIAERKIKHTVLKTVLGNKRKSQQAEDHCGGFVYGDMELGGVCGEEEYVRAYSLSRTKSRRKSSPKEKTVGTV